MNHTVEDLIKRINVMHDMACALHKARNAKPDYDATACSNLLADIQSMALLIAKDKQDNNEIPTEIDPRK